MLCETIKTEKSKTSKFDDIKRTWRRSNMLYLSLVENCLCQDIINRNGLNIFNTIYSYARSNIDYASYLEGINYYKFLDGDSLKLATVRGDAIFQN